MSGLDGLGWPTNNDMNEPINATSLPSSASVTHRDLEEVRIECEAADQEWLKAKMEKLIADKWEVTCFGSPKLNSEQYSTRLVLIAVRSKLEAKARAFAEACVSNGATFGEPDMNMSYEVETVVKDGVSFQKIVDNG